MQPSVSDFMSVRITPDLFKIQTDDSKFLFENIVQKEGQSLRVFLAVIQPGEYIPPHIHPDGRETYVYIVSGHVRHHYGANLNEFTDNQPGDLVHIPANLPHQPTNLSATEPVCALTSCNYDQNLPENGVPYDASSNKVLWELQGVHLSEWVHEKFVPQTK
jgi:uncharacterized RmlC-like cupin family protein